MIISKEPAYAVGHSGNLIGPADALLVLEVTMDTGQRLTSASGPRRNTSHQLADQRPRPATQSEAPRQGLPAPQIRMAQESGTTKWSVLASGSVNAGAR